ncbi:hypothetical protein BU26DRAFT_502414 [Trematosphaeria pertusa]|uniref:Uncharacterized protein n=1 Tax=Trematosphaeria pertusa TaxID=390896 RepID=A0A6A6IMZ5_9PLEO|nr:uncharacterized protein BU26DRAFT_502414 [Trematosphaeria pertusa]KAF2251821.1 hypothetical protein BU26DRAFT_502414 [Trematosphaeria pertusa]
MWDGRVLRILLQTAAMGQLLARRGITLKETPGASTKVVLSSAYEMFRQLLWIWPSHIGRPATSWIDAARWPGDRLATACCCCSVTHTVESSGGRPMAGSRKAEGRRQRCEATPGSTRLLSADSGGDVREGRGGRSWWNPSAAAVSSLAARRG